MARLSCTIRQLWQSAGILYTCISDAVWFLQLCLHSTAALAAENLFLRKQLALYQGRNVIPRCPTNATRFTLVWLSQWFDWRPALAVVQPETFQRWRRQRCKQFWRCASGPRRPPIPGELQALIRQMARDNLTWGQWRIANELQLKLGLRVSPRTVHKYIPTHLHPGPGQRTTSQRWRTFVRHHAWDLIARAVVSDLTRGMQAFGAWMRWLCQRWRRPIVASTLRGTPLHDATCLARPSAPASGLAVWSPVTVEAIRVDQRSPPDCGPSCSHDPGLAPRSPLIDRFDVYPTGAALYWWNRATPHTQDAGPLTKGGSRAVPWRRAA
jgi:hypothetical protein